VAYSDKGKNNVFNTVVKGDFCIGCGVCAAICPSKSIEIQMISGCIDERM